MKEVKVVHGSGTDIEGQIYYTTSEVGIQKAYNYVKNNGGGSVFITRGKYIIKSPVTILSSNLITLKGEGAGTILIAKGLYSSGFNIIRLESVSNITIKDLVLDGDIDEAKYGISINNAGTTYPAGLTSGDYSRYDSSTVGKEHPNRMGVIIENCIIQNINGIGIHSYDVNNSFILQNTIQGCYGEGLYMDGTVSIFSRKNVIKNNIMMGQDSSTIKVYNGLDNIITQNILQNNNGEGVYILGKYSSNNVISDNIIQNNQRKGIELEDGDQSCITTNVCQNNNSSGIYVSKIYEYSNITNNIVQNNSGVAVDTHPSVYVNISNNILQHNEELGVYNNRTTNVTSNIVVSNRGSGLRPYDSSGCNLSANISLKNSGSNKLQSYEHEIDNITS